MDIEGGETLALAGMEKISAASPDLIVVTEFNPAALKNANVNPVDFFKQIKRLGFSAHLITPKGICLLSDSSEINIDLSYQAKSSCVNLLLRKIPQRL